MLELQKEQLKVNPIKVGIVTNESNELILGRENIVALNAVINVPVSPNPSGGPEPGTAFTYSLSLGRICRHSKSQGDRNAFECGAHDASNAQGYPFY